MIAFKSYGHPIKMSPKIKKRKRKLLLSDKFLKWTMSFLVFCWKKHLTQLQKGTKSVQNNANQHTLLVLRKLVRPSAENIVPKFFLDVTLQTPNKSTCLKVFVGFTHYVVWELLYPLSYAWLGLHLIRFSHI